MNRLNNAKTEALLFEKLKFMIEETLTEKTADLMIEIKTVEERKSEKLLSIKDTADFLSVSNTTLWRLRKSGEIKTYMLGSQVYFKKSEILKSLVRVN